MEPSTEPQGEARARRRLAFLLNHKKKWGALGFVVALPFAFHLYVLATSRMQPPELRFVEPDIQVKTELASGSGVELRRAGSSYARRLGKITEARLVGSPAEIGRAHALLLKPEMDRTEAVVWGLFKQHVPSRLARVLLTDLARLRYGKLDLQYSLARREELAAQAQSYAPDPFKAELPTFQRMVYLNALYDISLSYEQSPLIGCTTFVGQSSEGGGLLARAFDFEVDPIFDREKVVFLVREEGKLPFASVAWAGLVGVVSGMNLKGLSVVVHGARAGEPRAEGEAVVHSLRRILSDAETSEQAVKILAETQPMVSHLVILNDTHGDAVVVERVPGEADHVRRVEGTGCVTNHLEGPARRDERNRRVRELTSTVQRRKRGDELVKPSAEPSAALDAARLSSWLRDRKLAGGEPLELGDRRAIDAGIATHGIIADSRNLILWVSEGPELDGAFIQFDLKRLLSPEYEPAAAEAARTKLPARSVSSQN